MTAAQIIAELESTAEEIAGTEDAPCEPGDLKAMEARERLIASQSRTLTLPGCGSEAADNTVEAPRSYCDKTMQNITLDPVSLKRPGHHVGSRSARTGEKTYGRSERMRHMEGPADTAGALAEKLSYFTYYELLYLDDDAAFEDVHSSYIKRVTDVRSRFRCGAFSQEWRLNEFVKVLHEAHTVLTSEQLRARYDERLASGQYTTNYKDLVDATPTYKTVASVAGTAAEVTVRDLLLAAGYADIDELKEVGASLDGPDLAQGVADAGLITFDELAAVLLGKALIDRRLVTLGQFAEAAAEMRNHSTRFIDIVVGQGWLSSAEIGVIGIS